MRMQRQPTDAILFKNFAVKKKKQRNEVIARGKCRLNGEGFFSLDKSYYKILVRGRKVTKFLEAERENREYIFSKGGISF